MSYALIKFRVHLLGERALALHIDDALLCTAMKSSHLSQRVGRWLSFFSECKFVVHYKPGKTNILADALSRLPDYDSRSALSRQEVDDDDNDDRCAMCASLNFTRATPSRVYLTKSSQFAIVIQITLTSLIICVLPATLH